MTLSVYIIGFNNQARVDRAFASVPNGFRKVLLDNGPAQLKAPDGVEYLKTGPGYFTDALNAGIIHALIAESVPIVCNDDIELEPGCLETLMDHIADGAGIACPIQVDMAVPDRVIMGGTMQAYPAGIHRIGTREQFAAMGPRDYPWLPFCVTALHPCMLQEVGLPDANLRMWFSDSDYAIRARQAGWRVMLDPRAVVRHEHSAATTEHRGPELDRVFVLDQAAFQRKWGGPVLEEYS